MKKFVLAIVLFFSTHIIFAQNIAAIRQKQFNITHLIAIKGYDPVAYFIQNKAVRGQNTIAQSADGVIYYFSSENNKALFNKNRSMYEPQYGGWCAYAMGAKGEKVEIDPETFKIIDGKLYLFYNAYFNNTLTSWNKDEKNLKAKADKNWLSIYK
jgi:YHS domain-containing protein